MSRRRCAALALLAACGAPAREVPQNRVKAAPDPCDMVEAMLSFDNAAYRQLYDSCADPEGRARIVAVDAPASLVPPGLRCEGRRFVMLAQHPHADFLILKLTLVPYGPDWNFVASAFQPVPAEVEGDAETKGFEVTTSYCVAGGGFITWKDDHWQTWYDLERVMRRDAT